MKNTQTRPSSSNGIVYYTNVKPFYDSVIAQFFDKEKMLIAFERDITVSDVRTKLSVLRHFLYVFDLYLDKSSLESILIEPKRTSESTIVEDKTILSVYKIQNNKKVDLLLKCKFDPNTSKLIGFAWTGITFN